MTINERIKKIRQTLKLPQTKFAEGISISNGYIAGLELGNRKVNDRIIKLVSSVYGVNACWLKTGEGDMFRGEVDDRLERLINRFQSLEPEFQDYLLQQIDQLIDLQERK